MAPRTGRVRRPSAAGYQPPVDGTLPAGDAGRAPGGKAEPDLLGERGRGLLVIDVIAADWGTTRHGTDTSVWFRLP